jgi:hypothetical protein
MQSARDFFLADARLPADQNAVRLRGDARQQLLDPLHRRRHPQPARDPGVIRGHSDQGASLLDQLLDVEGLCDVIARSQLEGLDGTVDRAVCGDEHPGRQSDLSRQKPGEQLFSAHIRQADIADHGRIVLPGNRAEGAFAGPMPIECIALESEAFA